MFRLTREIRFSLSPATDAEIPNAHAGYPQATTAAPFLTAQLTFESALDPKSQYVLDIKEIDQTFRACALPLLQARHADRTLSYDDGLLRQLMGLLAPKYPTARLVGLTLNISPFQSLAHRDAKDRTPMTTLNLLFEFSAAHRLHNPELPDEENRRLFGKCNNPHGHGHNYELQVAVLAGALPIPELEKLVHEAVIRPYDHKHLNVEVADFAETNPTVENIARAAFLRLRPLLSPKLVSVTVWETPKTWAEYSE